MCGIFAYYGPETDAAALVFNGLRELEYRGYDSWGVAVADNGRAALERQLGKLPQKAPTLPASKVGIGHTRWATTGRVTVPNAHPHTVREGKLAIVHNGVVENFNELRQEAIERGYALASETDSEVLGALVDYEITRNGRTIAGACRAVAKRMHGLGAFVVADLEKNCIAAFKVGSPLYVGRTETSVFLASDPSAILPHTANLYRLRDGECIALDGERVCLMDDSGAVSSEVSFETFSWDRQNASLGEHAHYLDKEICEQPTVLRRINSDASACAGVFELCRQATDVWLTGCGTAYYAALFGSYLFGSAGGPRGRAVHAHELPYLEYALKPTDCVLALSQSGETIDVLDAVKAAAKRTALVGALVNVPGSSLVFDVKEHVLLQAGPEKAVLSTKSFVAKLARLTQLALGEKSVKVIEDAARAIEDVLASGNREMIASLGQRLAGHEHLFVLGNGLLHPIALEGALKIKEGSYVHAEGFPAGDLKHGVIALIEEGTPVIALVPDGEQRERMITALEEVRARGAHVVGISRTPHPVFQEHIPVMAADLSFAIASVVPMQLLGYAMAVARGLDPDKPRNLAKSVTVR
jgi:glucosamine--fructose-6-phosphate aminotransferase (isomerizing)